MTKSEGRREEERRQAEALSSLNSPEAKNNEPRNTLNFNGDELELLNTKKINLEIMR